MLHYNTASVHCHSTHCDGKNSLAEMAQAAADLGMQTLGFSGHSLSFEQDPCGMTADDFAAYTAEITRLQQHWAGKLDILYGIEWDFYSYYLPRPSAPDAQASGQADATAQVTNQSDHATQLQAPAPYIHPDSPLSHVLVSGDKTPIQIAGLCQAPNLPFAYWIGSVHTLRDPQTGKDYTLDWQADIINDCIQTVYQGDAYAMVEGYFAAIAQMVSYRPTILGHFDVLKKLNADGVFFDETHPRYLAAAMDALAVAKRYDSVLEINTGGVFRGYREDFYPSDALLAEWCKMGGAITITADAHSADSLLFAYQAAAETAQKAGFQTVQTLTKSGFVPSALSSHG